MEKELKLEYKHFKSDNFKIRADEEGIIEAYVSVFGNVDLMNEVVEAGAFKESLQKKLPKGVWMHNWEKPIAKTLEAREDPHGLYIKGQLILDVQQAREAYILLKEGVIDEFSIGYQVDEDEIDENGVRHLKKLTLYEWSPVLVGANQQTEILNLKGVLPYHETPKAPEDEEWDASEEVKKAEVEDLKNMCAWYDSDAPEVKASYKLPHHKCNANYSVVWRGVAAAMAALMGARGGVDIPDKDWDSVYNHLAKHYEQFDKEPPEKGIKPAPKSEEEKEQKEGRVLSEKNRILISETLDQLEQLSRQIKNTIRPLKDLLSITEPEKSKGRKVEADSKVLQIRSVAKQMDKACEYILRITK